MWFPRAPALPEQNRQHGLASESFASVRGKEGEGVVCCDTSGRARVVRSERVRYKRARHVKTNARTLRQEP
jgi:hypothetical protein